MSEDNIVLFLAYGICVILSLVGVFVNRYVYNDDDDFAYLIMSSFAPVLNVLLALVMSGVALENHNKKKMKDAAINIKDKVNNDKIFERI